MDRDNNGGSGLVTEADFLTRMAEKTPTQRRRRTASPEAVKRREQLAALDANIDKVMGRVIRYAKTLDGLRAKRKRLLREIAKGLAGV